MLLFIIISDPFHRSKYKDNAALRRMDRQKQHAQKGNETEQQDVRLQFVNIIVK
jgi:hypothetical protein